MHTTLQKIELSSAKKLSFVPLSYVSYKNNAPNASIIPAMCQKTFFAQMKIKSFPITGHKRCQYQFNFKIENDAGIFTVVISSFQAQIKDAGSQPASLKHVAGRICIYKPNQNASMTLEQIKPGASISVGGSPYYLFQGLFLYHTGN